MIIWCGHSEKCHQFCHVASQLCNGKQLQWKGRVHTHNHNTDIVLSVIIVGCVLYVVVYSMGLQSKACDAAAMGL